MSDGQMALPILLILMCLALHPPSVDAIYKHAPLSRHGVHVDRLGAAWRQVALRDGRRRRLAVAPRQMAVLLARRPEGDVLGAELVVEELLQGDATNITWMKLN